MIQEPLQEGGAYVSAQSYSVIGESRDGYPLARAHLSAKNERKIGKRRARGKKTVKIIEWMDDGMVLVQVYRGKRWQHEEIARELLV